MLRQCQPISKESHHRIFKTLSLSLSHTHTLTHFTFSVFCFFFILLQIKIFILSKIPFVRDAPTSTPRTLSGFSSHYLSLSISKIEKKLGLFFFVYRVYGKPNINTYTYIVEGRFDLYICFPCELKIIPFLDST